MLKAMDQGLETLSLAPVTLSFPAVLSGKEVWLSGPSGSCPNIAKVEPRGPLIEGNTYPTPAAMGRMAIRAGIHPDETQVCDEEHDSNC
jgi:hypothetical protein